MAGYRLLIKPSAARETEALGSKAERRRVIDRIQALASEPRPTQSERLSGTGHLYRIRQGDYRVVYTIDDTSRVVDIVKVGHRREVYRRRP